MQGVVGEGVALLEKLARTRRLQRLEWLLLLKSASELAGIAAELAGTLARKRFGRTVFCRGIVEISNRCRNGCRYCGINRENKSLRRYCLSDNEVLTSCKEGYGLGLRTFVLQSGEDGALSDGRVAGLVEKIVSSCPGTAVTLSLGERSRKSYQRLFEAGASRYLLRHEAASPELYALLHPEDQSYWRRMECLHDLKAIGYQVGCGMMVGAPGQSLEHLALDMEFMQEFAPHMVGIGPFLPHHATDYGNAPAGDAGLTLFLLSLCRLLLPDVLLPATTALRTMLEDGLLAGIRAGCNVVMPDITPQEVKGDYLLYDGKPVKDGAKTLLESFRSQLGQDGFELSGERGDHILFA